VSGSEARHREGEGSYSGKRRQGGTDNKDGKDAGEGIPDQIVVEEDDRDGKDNREDMDGKDDKKDGKDDNDADGDIRDNVVVDKNISA
jgi:hypothetical protein